MRRHLKASSARPIANRKRGKGALIVAALALLALALTASPALAAFQYVSPVSFGAGAAFGPNPISVAVDNSANPADPSAGDIYVASGNAINRYTPAQAAAGSATPADQLTGFSYAWGVAVDPANGDVYATDYEVPDTVLKFDPEGNPLPFNVAALAGNLPHPAGIAVDPENGHVFVGDLERNVVYELDSSGAVINEYLGSTVSQGLAVNAAGELFVAAGGSGVVKFAGPGTEPTPFTANNGGGVAVDPTSQHVFVTGGASAAEFDAAGSQVGSSFGAGRLTDSYGIGIPSGGAHAYVADNPNNIAFDYSRLVVPDATTGAATAATGTTATLNGHLDPAGGPEASGCSFVFGTDPNLAGAETVPCDPAPPYVAATGVSADLSGLNPVTTYYFRLDATNSNGTERGTIESFQTTTSAPVVTTGQVIDFGVTTATLRGSVNPGGPQTSYHFEYGLTESYGSRAPAAGDSILTAGNQLRQVLADAAGLQPSTAYHYRLVATNSLGTTVGEDRTFTTDPAEGCPNAAIRAQQGSRALPDCRAYERVSPAENGGVPVGAGGNKSGFRARDDGDKVLFTTARASYPGAESAPWFPKVVATRTNAGWLATQIEKRTSSSTIAPFVASLSRTIAAVSKDMSHMVIASPYSLGGQGVDGNANIYIYDGNTGHYTLVETANDPSNFDYRCLVGLCGDGGWGGGSSDFRTIALLTNDLKGSSELRVWSESTGLRSLGLGSGVAPSGQTALRTDAVSEDGSRIYYTGSNGEYVALDENGVETIISVSRRAGDSQEPVRGTAEAASPDGRYLIFQAEAPLTEDASSEGGFYRYDADSGGLEFLAGTEGPHFLSGIVKAWPERGEAYFRKSTSLYHLDHGEVTFVAPGFVFGREYQMFSTSADGRYFGFESPERLTSYDNQGITEVYLYDAQTEVTSCASCRADGRGPTGRSKFEGFDEAVERRLQIADLEGHVSRAVTDDGTIFFDTPDPLVAIDVNGTRDVYSYRDGRVALISPGDQPYAAELEEVTPSGKDVFFSTAQRLLASDRDLAADIYDARVGGGFAEANVAPATCSGDSCRGATASPSETRDPSTEGLSGFGNPRPGARPRCAKKQPQHRQGEKAGRRCARQHQPKGKQGHGRRQGR